ncbi:MAG: DUF4394 domain-containing protein [Algoriphagus sp.]|nr:DUF4394 domain-containing protein [Algoriphagus sp.]
MKTSKLLSTLLGVSLLTTAMISCKDKEGMAPVIQLPEMAPEISFTALTEDGEIQTYDARELNSSNTSMVIKGLASGESIISIDYRPATGQLYGLSSMSRLYIINENSGMATQLGAGPFSPAISGENASIDFNPTVDRIRLVTESGQNLRLHPELGTVVATDGNINGGMNPRIGAVAYTNSFSGATSTILFDIDFEQDKLYQQVPPNEGGLQEVGDLRVDFEGLGDMDITEDNKFALAVNRNIEESRLYAINLMSGKAIWIGTFNDPVVSLAVKTSPIAFASDSTNKLYRFNPNDPEPTSVSLTGLMSGEMIVGLDFRPANGQLVAVSSMSKLYSVNTASGALAPIGTGFSPMIMGDFIGFDFNPTVDRIRLVTNQGQNLRLHPDLGTAVFVDGTLKPGTPMVNSAAYLNNFAGATTTTLFVLDSGNGMLYTQTPPNEGLLVPVGSLGVSFMEDNGFDIGGTSNKAFAVLTTTSGSGVYSINLMTGAATKVSDLNFKPTAMALGLGF